MGTLTSELSPSFCGVGRGETPTQWVKHTIEGVLKGYTLFRVQMNLSITAPHRTLAFLSKLLTSLNSVHLRRQEVLLMLAPPDMAAEMCEYYGVVYYGAPTDLALTGAWRLLIHI